jgi:hypothetical protein
MSQKASGATLLIYMTQANFPLLTDAWNLPLTRSGQAVRQFSVLYARPLSP